MRSMTLLAPGRVAGVSLDELDRRQHLAVTRRLKKADVGRVGVDDVHLLEVRRAGRAVACAAAQAMMR